MNDSSIGQLALSDLEKHFQAKESYLFDAGPDLPSKINSRDIIFPSSNLLGIPDLLIDHQCDELILPCLPYGKVALKKHEGCLHFYVDDYRFDPSFWVDPDKVKTSKVTAIIEPNYTLTLDSPMSWVIWSTYKKRWLARYWQKQGYNIIVDLNVPVEFAPISLLGVPLGWKSYATRGYSTRVESLLKEYELAVQHAQTEDIFFLVYGGGKTVLSICKERGWRWLASEESRAKGEIYE